MSLLFCTSRGFMTDLFCGLGQCPYRRFRLSSFADFYKREAFHPDGVNSLSKNKRTTLNNISQLAPGLPVRTDSRQLDLIIHIALR